MLQWFGEPQELFAELEELYNKHIHDNAERRFFVEYNQEVRIDLVELIEIDCIHRRAEFQIIINTGHQSTGYARELIDKALDYFFAFEFVQSLFVGSNRE